MKGDITPPLTSTNCERLNVWRIVFPVLLSTRKYSHTELLLLTRFGVRGVVSIQACRVRGSGVVRPGVAYLTSATPKVHVGMSDPTLGRRIPLKS